LQGALSGAHLVGKFLEVLCYDIERPFWGRFAGAGAAFTRPPDMAGAQALLCCRGEVGAVGRRHHALARHEIERFGGSQIDARLRLEIAGDLGAEDRGRRLGCNGSIASSEMLYRRNHGWSSE
jgi:hypothetical protein